VGSEIRRANRAAVLRDRASWHRVLPVEESDDVLLRPWGDFHKTRRPDPADLLLPGFGVVPYLFRDADLTAASAWCESAEALAVSVVPGRGGAGKTRFALELCRRMEHPDRGWVCGMWDAAQVAAASLAALPLPRLIVVDYTESEDLPALRSLLDRLRRQATDIAPARVLLLTRSGVARARDPILTLREDATPSVWPAGWWLTLISWVARSVPDLYRVPHGIGMIFSRCDREPQLGQLRPVRGQDPGPATGRVTVLGC